MKIVRLDIDEDSILAGIDAMSLVEAPAIQEGFYYFAKEQFAETYSDYPEAAVEAAKQGIKRNEETGNKCATQVGKVRAQQLANRETVSLETVRRMRAFLIRQKDNYELARDRRDYNACGYISYLLWGGPAALPWTEKILRQAGETFVKDEFEGLEDACQTGYVAYGLKRKRGRLVPNCVPKQNFTNLVVEDIIKLELQKMGALDSTQLNIHGYQTKHFDVCPVATSLFTHILTMNVEDTDSVVEAAVMADGVFAIEKQVLQDKAATPEQLIEAITLAKTFKDEIADINEDTGMIHDVSFMDGHIQTIASFVNKTEFELVVSGLPNYLNEPTGKLEVNREASYGFAAVEDQQMLIGPAMVPGKLIPRKDEDGDVYYVYFTKDTIKKLAYKAMKDKIIDRVNIEHNSGELVDDVYLVESWIVEDPKTDKARMYGLNPVEGTWMTMYKVDNLGVWEGYVRPGLVKGFSIEGYFAEQVIKQ